MADLIRLITEFITECGQRPFAIVDPAAAIVVTFSISGQPDNPLYVRTGAVSRCLAADAGVGVRWERWSLQDGSASSRMVSERSSSGCVVVGVVEVGAARAGAAARVDTEPIPNVHMAA